MDTTPSTKDFGESSKLDLVEMIQSKQNVLEEDMEKEKKKRDEELKEVYEYRDKKKKEENQKEKEAIDYIFDSFTNKLFKEIKEPLLIVFLHSRIRTFQMLLLHHYLHLLNV